MFYKIKKRHASYQYDYSVLPKQGVRYPYRLLMLNILIVDAASKQSKYSMLMVRIPG
jgi:hypothetical protein